jgi:hypothetical protein
MSVVITDNSKPSQEARASSRIKGDLLVALLLFGAILFIAGFAIGVSAGERNVRNLMEVGK